MLNRVLIKKKISNLEFIIIKNFLLIKNKRITSKKLLFYVQIFLDLTHVEVHANQ